MKTIRIPKPADPFSEEIKKRHEQLQALNNRTPRRPSLAEIRDNLNWITRDLKPSPSDGVTEGLI